MQRARLSTAELHRRGPDWKTLDLSLQKRFAMAGALTMQLSARIEF